MGDSEISGVYQYQPLQAHDSLRFAELLPGDPHGPIQILLRELNLSDLPTCSAVSYEWGSTIRESKIFCHGKFIKATDNLVAFLKKLRSLDRSHTLWIDAVCINQDDLNERSQQVPLMREIYQKASEVLIWIGDETDSTSGAVEIIGRLAAASEKVDSKLRAAGVTFRRFKLPTDIPELLVVEWEKFLDDPSWPGVSDILSSRTYFRRLWIIQEVVLSSHATVICGSHQIPWEKFHGAAMLLEQCQFLQKGLHDYQNLSAIVYLDRSRMILSRPLSWLMIVHSGSNVTDPRDRVYGLLGMLSPGEQKNSLLVDYTLEPEDVFRRATEAVIIHEQSLKMLRMMSIEPASRAAMSTPTWVRLLGPSHIASRFSPQEVRGLSNLFPLTQKLIIEGDFLIAPAVIVDVVEAVTSNASADTFRKIIAELFCVFISAGTVVGAFKQLLLTVNIAGSDLETMLEDSCQVLSSYVLDGFGLTRQTIEGNPILKDLSKTSSDFAEHFSEESQSEERVQDLFARTEPLKCLSEYRASGDGHEHQEAELKFNLFDPKLKLGRNVFRTCKGFVGVGPAGRNDREDIPPAVQVGDVLALMPTAPTPVILRLQEDGNYILVGSSNVGNLLTVPLFKDGKIPNTIALKIR